MYLCNYSEIHFLNSKKKKQSTIFWKSKKLFSGCNMKADFTIQPKKCRFMKKYFAPLQKSVKKCLYQIPPVAGIFSSFPAPGLQVSY